MISSVEERYDDYEGTVMIFAENQEWDKKTLKQLKDEHNIIFMSNGDGVRPVKVIRDSKNYYVAIGSEDDGIICFDKSYGVYRDMFSDYWIDTLIADLQEAKKYIAKLKGEDSRGKG